MGQKVNPNCYNFFKNKFSLCETPVTYNDYSKILFYNLQLKPLFSNWFLRNKCFVKQFYIFNFSKNKKLLIYVSFLPFMLKKKPKVAENKSNVAFKNFFQFLKNLGYQKQKFKVIFHNLKLKTPNNFLIKNKEFKKFNKELYFKGAGTLLDLFNSTRFNSNILASFICYYFKLFHRSRKGFRFLKFLKIFCGFYVKKLKFLGIKIQIKGRFRGAARSSSRIFQEGVVPLQTISSNISYCFKNVNTSYGSFGIKVWLNEKKYVITASKK